MGPSGVSRGPMGDGLQMARRDWAGLQYLVWKHTSNEILPNEVTMLIGWHAELYGAAFASRLEESQTAEQTKPIRRR
jgi:hypothetical protein